MSLCDRESPISITKSNGVDAHCSVFLLASDVARNVYERGNPVFKVRQQLLLGVKPCSGSKDV